MKKVTIYSTPTCVYCNMAKKFFQANNVEYTDYDVATNMEKRKEMIDKSGQLCVPVIDIEGKVIVGFDEEEIRSAVGI